MPQLDLSFYPSQIFWLIISFGLLYFILDQKLLKAISRIIILRAEKINKDISDANSLKDDAERLKAKYQELIKNSYIETKKMHKEKDEQIIALSKAENEKLNNKAQLAKDKSDDFLVDFKKRFYSELNDLALDNANSIIERLTKSKATKKELEKYIN